MLALSKRESLKRSIKFPRCFAAKCPFTRALEVQSRVLSQKNAHDPEFDCLSDQRPIPLAEADRSSRFRLADQVLHALKATISNTSHGLMHGGSALKATEGTDRYTPNDLQRLPTRSTRPLSSLMAGSAPSAGVRAQKLDSGHWTLVPYAAAGWWAHGLLSLFRPARQARHSKSDPQRGLCHMKIFLLTGLSQASLISLALRYKGGLGSAADPISQRMPDSAAQGFARRG